MRCDERARGSQALDDRYSAMDDAGPYGILQFPRRTQSVAVPCTGISP